MYLSTGKAAEQNALLEALARGRNDHEFFGEVFLGRKPHPAQLDYIVHAEATLNILATANRFGKTYILPHVHYHSGVYKAGGEQRFLDDDGEMDLEAYLKLKYHTVHTAGDWETAALVWDEALKMLGESKYLQAFVKDSPRSKPPHIDFINGARWKFRTLGHDASGIDGNSFYVISIDEAGWIENLETLMRNVIRVRVADVRGRIHIVGTFKPGISRDFYKFAKRAAAYTGAKLGFEHKDALDEDDVGSTASLASSIRSYLREYGINLDEYEEAIRGE